MPKVVLRTAERVSYTVSRTIGLANYSSIRLECGGARDVEHGQGADEAFELLRVEVDDRLNKVVDEAMAQLTGKPPVKKPGKKTGRRTGRRGT